MYKPKKYPVSTFIETLRKASSFLKADRKLLLNKVVEVIKSHDKEAKVVFVCTHNSRRSQAAELLLHLISEHFKRPIITESAGTESTAFHGNMVKAFNSFGVNFLKYDLGNPLYIYQEFGQDKYLYSKRLEELDYQNSILITVCGDAKDNCPLILDGLAHLHLGYTDPKSFDGSDDELTGYQGKILEIGAELYYLVKRIAF